MSHPHFVSFDIYDAAGVLVHADATDIIRAAVFNVVDIAAATANKARAIYPEAGYIAVSVTPFAENRTDGFVTHKRLIICR